MKTIDVYDGRFVRVAKVDDDDFEWLNQFRWYIASGGYAQKTLGGTQTVRMQQEIITTVPIGFEIDHIDRDKLNNQKINLRLVTKTENRQNSFHTRNTSGFKGVNWDKNSNKWQARICRAGKRTSLGFFDSPEDGAKVYDEAALKLYGPNALTNKKLGLLDVIST